MGEIEESIWDDYRGRYSIARGDGAENHSWSRVSPLNRKRGEKEKRETTQLNWSRSWAAAAAATAVHLAQSIYYRRRWIYVLSAVVVLVGK